MAFNLPELRNSTDSARIRRQNYFDNLLEDFFNDFYSPIAQPFSRTGVDLPTRIDISETDSEYNLEAELPGISLKDIDVKIDNNILTIKGNKEESTEKKERNYYMRERYYGTFQRSIVLPNNIMDGKIKAEFENGILHIAIPKKNQDSAKKIEVKSK
jgi:HSP20 family protein